MEATDHPLSQVTFQLDEYHRAVHTPEEQFQRMALVQVFHEAVLSESSMEEIEDALREIIELDVEGFYRKSGADLLETAIVLTCLHPSALVDRYLTLLLDHSQLKDLISAWSSSLQSLAQYSSPDPPTFIKRLQASSDSSLIWDRSRLFTCLSFAAILDRCSLDDFTRLVESETSGMLAVLSWKDPPPSELFLQSSELASLVMSLQTRISELKNEDLTLSLLKLISHVIGLFPDPDVDWPLEDTLITTLFALEIDFYSLLQTWRDWYISIYSSVDDLDQHAFHPHGIASLISKSVRLILPIANLLFESRPDVGVRMIARTVEDMAGEKFRTVQSPFLWVTEYRQWTLQFLKELLDLRRDYRVETEKVTSLFANFLQLFTAQHRFLLLRRLAIEYQYDLEIGLILSLYTSEIPINPVFAQPLFVLEMTKIALGKRPLNENIVSLTSAMDLLDCLTGDKAGISAETARKIREESLQPNIEEAELMCGEGKDEEVEELLGRMRECQEKLTAVKAD